MGKLWDYSTVTQPTKYGDDFTYTKAAEYLDIPGAVVEDWGCGTTYGKKFFKNAKYIGVDFSPSKFTDIVADLRGYKSKADCILIRHVLEHNFDWLTILGNAVDSFRRRMVVVTFTPFAGGLKTELITWNENPSVPDLSLCRKCFESRLYKTACYSATKYPTDTQYNSEEVFLIDKCENPTT